MLFNSCVCFGVRDCVGCVVCCSLMGIDGWLFCSRVLIDGCCVLSVVYCLVLFVVARCLLFVEFWLLFVACSCVFDVVCCCCVDVVVVASCL